ncbi:hypothetical protein Tco_0312388 [Tanacetum coccineum]
MSMTKEQQQALDDALVLREQRLTIGSCNYRLSTTFKPKEPTFQVALDVLTLTPFYPAFLITASVPAVYMQEFWATVTYQKHHIRFKMNKKSYSFDMETFRNMLLICPKLPGQKFVDPPFEEEILNFIRELGYPGNIKLLSDVKVDTLPQPWRTFGTIINKCLSGKVTGIDTLRLSRAQILWGLYHQEKVDYVYLLWEDLVFQIENKESRKNKYMFYPRFTKVIINHFMSQDQSIPRRNKVDWHMANDDHILTTMRFIPQHEVVQRYGAILPDYLTNPAMKDLSVKDLRDLAMESQNTTSTHASTQRSGAHEGTGVTPGVPDVPDYESDDEKISWKSSEEEGCCEENVSEHEDDDDDERTEFDNDGDDFVHPKFSTHDDEAKQDEEVHEDDNFDPKVQTLSHVESTDDEDSDDVTQDANVEGDMINEEETREEVEANVLYQDVNVNLEGRYTHMIDVPLPNVQATQETEDTHVILTAMINPEGQQQSSLVSPGFVSNMLNPRPDTSIDSIFNLNTEATSLVDVPVTTIVEPPLVIEKTVNEQLEDEVMTHSTTESKTSLAITANLSELELKKILIEKIESNKSIYRIQPWLSNLAREEGPRESFDELMDTPLDFSVFMMNRLKINTLTPKLLVGPTFELMKGTCKSLVELEYFFEEVYKETTDRLDWHNPEGRQYPHDLRKPLPLIPNSRGHQVIPFDHFINNDLAYLSGGVSSRTYATSITKIKAADYGHIKWIEDLVPNTIWSEMPVNYDKHALWGISYWGRKRQQFYGFAANRESAHDIYSKHRIITVTKLQIVKWHGYKHLDWITVHRDDDKLYTFKEGD